MIVTPSSSDWCEGCAKRGTPEYKDLPPEWVEGDDIPDDITRHSTLREGVMFVFKHPACTNNRVFLEK